MAHLHSNNTKTIYISSGSPISNIETSQVHAIQGPTTITYNFSGVTLGDMGVYDFHADLGDGTSKQIEVKSNDNGLFTVLPDNTTVEHTYYQQLNTDNNDITVNFIVKYLNGGAFAGQPLSANHTITLKQTPLNLIDKNFEIANNQLITNNQLNLKGDPIPYFNLESEDNVIYPMAYAEIVEQQFFVDAFYINTDPEDNVATEVGQTFLYRTLVSLGPDVLQSAQHGISALSGSGFTIQGKSGKLFTFAAGLSSEPLSGRYFGGKAINGSTWGGSYDQTNSILLSTNFDGPLLLPSDDTINSATSKISFFRAVTAVFEPYLGTEFNNIIVDNNGDVAFLHSNLLPPEATLYTTTASQSASVNGQVGYAVQDQTYTYQINQYGVAGYPGLSAVSRMKTDPDALLIRAL